MRTPNPQKVKVPPIEHYGGTTNLIDHLAGLQSTDECADWSKAAWCKFFPTTLKGLALTWFTEHPPGSISDFASLEAAFK